MKKNLILACASVITCNAVAPMRQQEGIRMLPEPGIVEYYKPAPKEKTAQDAFDKVLPKLQEYEQKASPAERDNFIKYLDYYKSWGGYQSVTPAPISITSKLTPDDRDVEKFIKYEAQDFVTEPESGEQPRMGASTLSREGDNYYRMIINYFTPSSRSNKPLTPHKKPMRIL
jgi:hypothetical protein